VLFYVALTLGLDHEQPFYIESSKDSLPTFCFLLLDSLPLRYDYKDCHVAGYSMSDDNGAMRLLLFLAYR